MRDFEFDLRVIDGKVSEEDVMEAVKEIARTADEDKRGWGMFDLAVAIGDLTQDFTDSYMLLTKALSAYQTELLKVELHPHLRG